MIYQYPPTAIQLPFSTGMCLPPLYRVYQTYPDDALVSPEGNLTIQLRKLLSMGDSLEGKRIAITVGSRGIPHLRKMVAAIGSVLKTFGALPFIVPCMGSHGGATAEGQKAILTGYGITEDAVNMPVHASMETVCYGHIGDIPLYCDRYAAEADGIVVFNKIKPHTDFHGRYESGLAKMMTIGLGKHRGATAFHSLGFSHFAELLPQVQVEFLSHFHVLCGIGVLQNERDDIFHVEVIPVNALAKREPELLEIARARLPHFPLRDVDLLVLDEVGKNISGSGFDPNIFARAGDPVHDCHTGTRYRRLYIRSLTKESNHMGTGVFHADFASRRLVSDVDWSATWTNCVTCQLSTGRGIPIYLDSDREALEACMQTLTPLSVEEMAVLWARNTLDLSEFLVSHTLYEQLQDVPGLRFEAIPYVACYDGKGYLNSAFGEGWH
jgi:hypothetical protein